MAKLFKYSDDMLGWKRPAGPLRVWRIVEGRRKNSDRISPRFSIQEVPEDRFGDVLDLMCSVFINDEPICQHSKASEDFLAVEDFCKLWSLPLQKGLVTGAFLVDDAAPKPVLAGVNMTLVACKTLDESLRTRIKLRSVIANNILSMMHDLETEANVRELYGVENFITAYGLCVHPSYRGHGLGRQMLQARDDMAAAYDIRATMTVFTSPFAQKNAALAGFEAIVERDFVDIRNDEGTELFPGISQKKVILMGKKFSG